MYFTIDLVKVDNLSVITYVKNDEEIQRQLKELGITNIIHIYDIFNLFDNTLEGIAQH